MLVFIFGGFQFLNQLELFLQILVFYYSRAMAGSMKLFLQILVSYLVGFFFLVWFGFFLVFFFFFFYRNLSMEVEQWWRRERERVKYNTFLGLEIDIKYNK